MYRTIFEISKKNQGWITAPNFTPALKTYDKIAIFSKATQRYLYHSKFSSKECCKIVEHSGISGWYRGVLCRKYNLKLRESYQTDDI